MGSMKMDRKILAVHDRDLIKFLSELNLITEMESGNLKCPYCACTLTLENIGFINKIKEKFWICCDDISCFYRLKSATDKSNAPILQSDKHEENDEQQNKTDNNPELESENDES